MYRRINQGIIRDKTVDNKSINPITPMMKTFCRLKIMTKKIYSANLNHPTKQDLIKKTQSL